MLEGEVGEAEGVNLCFHPAVTFSPGPLPTPLQIDRERQAPQETVKMCTNIAPPPFFACTKSIINREIFQVIKITRTILAQDFPKRMFDSRPVWGGYRISEDGFHKFLCWEEYGVIAYGEACNEI